MKYLKRYLLFVFTALSVSGGVVAENVNVLNWGDCIAENTLTNLEKKTGFDVTYDVFDSNEVPEAELLSGNSGYDAVAPTSEFLSRQVKTGAFIKLDKTRLPNWKKLDPDLLDKRQGHDKGNQYAVPYMRGTTGIGSKQHNPKDYAKVEEVLSGVREYITYFHSSRYIADLANGDIAVAIGWSGDVRMASTLMLERLNAFMPFRKYHPN
ncbi:hypothetical protein [Parendozoicomonas sp. Alg238-R29]|uniref:hypothetical protein n=1 Tax=Parendozoicomonas sp. Alg238-R29 TaxID=2993446 RepID=UPI00248EA1E5|nr:hypothetical protein [Parendozoicomonas sp. Alg238-R29]